MIEFVSVTYAYPGKEPVFKEFDWDVRHKEAWAVLGPSGCGKTTLLYLLAGLRFPNSGQVRIHGEALTRPHPQTGLILQDFGLLPWATVKQNASLGLQVRTFYGPDGKHAPADDRPSGSVDKWLNRLGLDAVANQYPGQISGGQRQRAAIARTLVLQPELLLMDEPFSSLDAPTRENLQNLTLDLQEEEDLTLVIVTHAIEEAAVMGRKILLLGNPPNREPVVIENPNAGLVGFRNTREYQMLCADLRQRLGAATESL